MSGAIFDIPSYSVPKEAFEVNKTRNLSLSGRLEKSRATSGSVGRRGKPAMTFTVEEFKKGVTIGTQGSAQGTETEGTKPIELPGVSLNGTRAGRTYEVTGDLPAEDYGRRYRPLDNGRMAEAGQRQACLSDEQKIAKLKQIKQSAEEYEGFLLAEMIKNMRQSPMTKVAGNETYSEIAEKPFTAAITQAGGLGLSQTIINQVAAQEGLGDVLISHPEVMGPNWRQRLAPSQMPKPGLRPAAAESTDSAQPVATSEDQAESLTEQISEEPVLK
jgi:Rod binding domain-containing protein